MARASLSTVIVAHDSLTQLREALPPLIRQLEHGDELIVVDNASRDRLGDELVRLAPEARLIRLGENVGFAAGANRGVDAARGDLVVLLNPDAVVQPGWLEAIRAPWGGPWSGWMGLVLLDGGRTINTSGGMLHFTGFGWAGQVGESVAAAPSAPSEVGFLSGACLAVPRATWHELGGFSDHFFMYCEDVDLSLKLRLRGGRMAVVPDARVLHDYSFVKGDDKWRLLERNRWAVIIRTYPGRLLLLISPALIAAELAVWVVASRGGWARVKAQATVDVLTGLRRLLRERRAIQDGRRVSARLFAASMTPELSSPYLLSGRSSRWVSGALRLYWRAVLALLG
jgi:N-acetylglucosaminyl-diphospho-decaprenol L-rhamnosyltransferase